MFINMKLNYCSALQNDTLGLKPQAECIVEGKVIGGTSVTTQGLKLNGCLVILLQF